MKNRKKKIGFTLIELLAVIIVLAIIALIATPIIFNVIENAKLKSLENSCYGIIDGVRTKYAEGLLNSIDGTVKLKGNVTEITVAGEQPIAGTWEIDNSSDSDNRGIKIKDVKFGSMKDYTCTNVNSDGTINSKVTCTKGGDSSNDDNDEDILYNVKLLKSYDINYDKCMENYDDEDFCSVPEEFFNKFSHSARIFFDEDLRNELIDNGTIENVQYKQAQLSCFGKELINLKYDVDQDKCVPLASLMIGGEEANTEYVQETAQKLCNGEIIIGNSTDYFVTNVPYFFEYIGLISNVSYDQEKENTIGNYRCYEGNMYGMPVISDVKIPSNIEEIGETAFSSMGITSIDFSKATNLRKIGHSAFYSDSLTSLDLTNQKKLETIEEQAFFKNEISGTLNLTNLSKLKKIGSSAFGYNQITSVGLGGLTNLETIDNLAFNENQISGDLDLSDLINLKTIGKWAFSENQISVLNLKNLKKLTTIGEYAFGWSQIKEVDLSDLINIRDLSGFNNNQISSLDLSNLTKLESVVGHAFSSNQIESLIFGNLPNLIMIDDYSFSYNEIINLDLSKTVNIEFLSGFDGNQISSLDLSNLVNLKTIGISAFSGNQINTLNLESLKNLNEISFGAFKSNKINIINLNNLSNLKTIGKLSFYRNEISDLELNGLLSLEKIDESAFYDNKITSLTLKNLPSLKTIEKEAFYDNNLTKLDLSQVVNLTTLNGFSGNQITDINLPTSIIKIGSGAFWNNKIVGKLDFSKLTNLTTIGANAFNLNDLTNVIIPNSVTTIGDDAFKISSITSIEIDNIKDSINGSPWGADNATITWKRS